MSTCPHCQTELSDPTGPCGRCAGRPPTVDATPPPAAANDSAANLLLAGADSVLARAVRASGPATGTGIVLPSLAVPEGGAVTVRGRPLSARSGAALTAVEAPRVDAPRPNTTPADGTPALRPPAAVTPPPVSPPPAPPAVVPKLVVLRGERPGTAFPLYDGKNTIGRFADKPVDVDLEGQEPVERIRVSRHHATVTVDRDGLRVEDMNSLNGTWLNGVRISPGLPRRLSPGDTLQVGTVQMKVVVE